MLKTFITWVIEQCPTEFKVAAFSGSSSLASIALGWINVDLLLDTVMVATISTAIGYYGTKLLKLLDLKIKEWKNKK